MYGTVSRWLCTNRKCVFIGVFLNLKLFFVTVVQIHYNIDDDCAFVFAECTARCGVGAGRTGGAFVLVVCASILKLLFVFYVV